MKEFKPVLPEFRICDIDNSDFKATILYLILNIVLGHASLGSFRVVRNCGVHKHTCANIYTIFRHNNNRPTMGRVVNNIKVYIFWRIYRIMCIRFVFTENSGHRSNHQAERVLAYWQLRSLPPNIHHYIQKYSKHFPSYSKY